MAKRRPLTPTAAQASAEVFLADERCRLYLLLEQIEGRDKHAITATLVRNRLHELEANTHEGNK